MGKRHPTPSTKQVFIEIAHEIGREEAKRRVASEFHLIVEQLLKPPSGFLSRSNGDTFYLTEIEHGSIIAVIDVTDGTIRITLVLVYPWHVYAMQKGFKDRLRNAALLLVEKR